MGWLSDTWKSVKENPSGVCHGILDVAGFIPGLGAVPDLLNAGLYAMEGNMTEAGLSVLAAVPGVGDVGAAVGKGGKYLLQSSKLVNGSGKGIKAVKKFQFFGKLKGLGKTKLLGKIKTGAKSAFAKGKSLLKKITNKFKRGCKGGNGCFLQDTLVWTENGLRPIQNLEIGEWVYSRDSETGEVGRKEIKRVFVNRVHTIYTIRLNEHQEIKTTNYHPFYVEERGWVCAIQLKVGDRLCTIEGEAGIVASVEKERIEEGILVYNFEVADWNSYFVSELGVCVHNTKTPCGGTPKKNGTYEKASYHGNKNNPVKNKAPNDGQGALDNSVPIGPNTTRRVGTSDGEIVVLDETTKGIFHGHVRSFDELSESMKAVLRKAGMVNKKGKIL